MINARRHTEKVLCCMLVFNAVAGCTSNMKEYSDEILNKMKVILEAEKDARKRNSTLVRARAAEKKVFKPVVGTNGIIVVGVICSTLNKLQAEGYEIFDADDFLADVFQQVVKECRFSGKDMVEVNKLSDNWILQFKKEGYFK